MIVGTGVVNPEDHSLNLCKCEHSNFYKNYLLSCTSLRCTYNSTQWHCEKCEQCFTSTNLPTLIIVILSHDELLHFILFHWNRKRLSLCRPATPLGSVSTILLIHMNMHRCWNVICQGKPKYSVKTTSVYPLQTDMDWRGIVAEPLRWKAWTMRD